MQNTGKSNFIINDWHISPAEGLVEKNGTVIHLEPRVMEVLVYLASRQGDVVTRDEIEKDVWRGALISYDAITSTIIKIRKAFDDDARNPAVIATIPKRGYQLIAPVNYIDTGGNNGHVSSAGDESSPGDKTQRSISRIVIAVATLASLAVAATAWFLSTDGLEQEREQQPLASPNSIIVLPFENLSNDQQQGYLADGMTEDITTDLSNLSNLLVLSSSTANTYRGMKVNPEEVGDKLDVDYVLQGSIWQHNDRIRVNVQLSDTGSG